MGVFNIGITFYADVRLNTHLILWIGLSSWESACGLRPVNDRWMGRGVLLECLLHVFEVLMHRRLLIVYRTRQSASSFTHFHSEPLPAGQICQSKGRGRINIIRAGSASVALSPLGWYEQASVWNRAVMGPYFLLTLMAVSMCLRAPFTSAWYVAYFGKIDFKMQHHALRWLVLWSPWTNEAFIFSFCRTVNNFLMTGPKVNW